MRHFPSVTHTVILVVAGVSLFLAACKPSPQTAFAQTAHADAPADSPSVSRIRATGSIQAKRSYSIQVPRITGQQGNNLTLTKLIPNGTTVHAGDVLAEFDRLAQIKASREADAKCDDLGHQIEQKAAEQHSNSAKRLADLAQANADLEKAKLEIRKGPVLSEIEQKKNAVKLKDAEFHVSSLAVSIKAHEQAEAAELKVVQLQLDRQKMTLVHLQNDAERLVLKAPLNGMVALENIWRNGTMGHAKEGDKLWPGRPLLRIFDPSTMVLSLAVNEADGAVLQPGARAIVRLDAYPEIPFTAHFDSASPVASSAIDSPLKTFSAQFVLEQNDPHLLPDLAAAADLELPRK